MNKIPEKNVQIGNNIIDLSEVSAITFTDREIPDGGPRISFKLKANSGELQVVFDNQESFYTTKANLKKLTKPLDITVEIQNPPPDNYLDKKGGILQD